MFGRVLVFAVGVTVGVVVVLKAKDYLAHKVPEAVTDKINQSATGAFDRVATFASDARAAMAERESELRDALGLVEDRDDSDGADRARHAAS